jgi:MFS family permease
MVTVVVSGIWSDRMAQRRVFVCWSGIVMSVAALLLGFWPTWTGAIIAAAILGLGFGVYLSVDFALMTEVLPAASDRGKDLGVINVANSLPQVLAPALAAPIVTYLGGYPVLFTVSALVGVAGSVLVYRIRSVS